MTMMTIGLGLLPFALAREISRGQKANQNKFGGSMYK